MSAGSRAKRYGTAAVSLPACPIFIITTTTPLKTNCGEKGFPGAISVELKYKRVNIRTTIKLAITYQGFAVCLVALRKRRTISSYLAFVHLLLCWCRAQLVHVLCYLLHLQRYKFTTCAEQFVPSFISLSLHLDVVGKQISHRFADDSIPSHCHPRKKLPVGPLQQQTPIGIACSFF